MPRRHVTISTETVDALLGDVAAGRSLSAACRDRGIKRSTTADRFSEPTLAARLEAARAAGKGVRASRPRRRRASAPTGATQPDHGAAAGQPAPIVPRPPVDAPAPAAGQSSRIPVAHVVGDVVYLDMDAVALAVGALTGRMAAVAAAAQAEPHR